MDEENVGYSGDEGYITYDPATGQPTWVDTVGVPSGAGTFTPTESEPMYPGYTAPDGTSHVGSPNTDTSFDWGKLFGTVGGAAKDAATWAKANPLLAGGLAALAAMYGQTKTPEVRSPQPLLDAASARRHQLNSYDHAITVNPLNRATYFGQSHDYGYSAPNGNNRVVKLADGGLVPLQQGNYTPSPANPTVGAPNYQTITGTPPVTSRGVGYTNYNDLLNAATGGIDYAHYGQGPEHTFFDNSDPLPYLRTTFNGVQTPAPVGDPNKPPIVYESPSNGGNVGGSHTVDTIPGASGNDVVTGGNKPSLPLITVPTTTVGALSGLTMNNEQMTNGRLNTDYNNFSHQGVTPAQMQAAIRARDAIEGGNSWETYAKDPSHNYWGNTVNDAGVVLGNADTAKYYSPDELQHHYDTFLSLGKTPAEIAQAIQLYDSTTKGHVLEDYAKAHGLWTDPTVTTQRSLSLPAMASPEQEALAATLPVSNAYDTSGLMTYNAANPSAQTPYQSAAAVLDASNLDPGSKQILSNQFNTIYAKQGADAAKNWLVSQGPQALLDWQKTNNPSGYTGNAMNIHFANGGQVNQGALGYLAGGTSGQSDMVPAKLSHGEYVMDADTVAALGDGNNAAGAQKLDHMRQQIRKHKRSSPVDKIPPPAKSPLAYLGKGV